MILPRRDMLELGMAAAASVMLPAAATPDRTAGPQVGDVFVPVSDPGGSALRPEAIHPEAAPILAWPKERATGLVRDGARFNQVLVLRVAQEPGQALSEQLVAFTAICPHAGCLVSGWIAETHRLHCPCHGSEYDPAGNGAVVGGPSPLPLPTLAVEVRDGLLTVVGAFSAKPGGHTSRTI